MADFLKPSTASCSNGCVGVFGPFTLISVEGVAGALCSRTSGATAPNQPSTCSCPFGTISHSGDGPDSSYVAWDRYYDFMLSGSPAPLGAGLSIHVVWDYFGTVGNSLTIAAWNGSVCTTLLAQGCVTTSGSTNLTLPAGTTRLVVKLTGGCNSPTGSTDLWSFTITCN